MIKKLPPSIKKYISTHIWNYERIQSRPVWLSYSIPFFLIIITSWAKFNFFATPVYRVPFLLFLAIILLSACYGGSRAAFYAVCMSFISTILLLSFPPDDAWNITNTHIHQSITFMFEALLICILISRIQLTHEKLQQSEERFRGIIENTEEGFFMLNEDYNITYCTPSVKQMLGFELEELKETKLYSLIHKEDIESLKLALLRLINKEEQANSLQYRLKTANNQWIWVESIVSNLLDDKKIGVIVVHFRNITERVTREKQQEDFVHMATHELKSPVTVLKGYLQLIISKMEKESQHEHLKLLHRMDGQIHKLITLIADMLDSTKLLAGELNHKFDDFNLNDCIRECVDAVKTTDPNYTINLELEPADPQLTGDAERIGQVITNFISNAIKYSPDKRHIKISSKVEHGWAKVSVRDYGIGIPKEKQHYIFDRFYRVDQRKAEFHGLGLGLYIASEIIKMHHGKIGVDSVLDEGSTFWFSIPVNS